MTRKARFDEAAREAAERGRSERQAQGRLLAEAFEADPAGFDPKRLQSLGRIGLSAFCAAIAEPLGPRETKAGADKAMPERQPQGWAAQRRPEIGFLARAISCGAGGGLLLILIPPLLRLFSL